MGWSLPSLGASVQCFLWNVDGKDAARSDSKDARGDEVCMQNKGLLFFLSPSSLRCLFGGVILGWGGLIGDGAQADSSRPTQRKQPAAQTPKTPLLEHTSKARPLPSRQRPLPRHPPHTQQRPPLPALIPPTQPATLPRPRPATTLLAPVHSVSAASRTHRKQAFDPPTLRWERLFVQRSRDGLCGTKGRMLGLFKLSSPRCLVTFDYGVRTCRNAMRQLPHYRVSDATTADLWGKMWSICLGMTFNMRYVYQHTAVP
jgi:hypothetical protein